MPDLSHMRSTGKQLLRQLATLALIAAVLWGVLLLDAIIASMSSFRVSEFGIRPREWRGLTGILTAPLLHLDATHLMRNLPPLLMLGWLVMLEGIARFWRATALIAAVSGIAVWVFGQSHANYLGSSAVAFGYLSHVLMRAWITRRMAWIIAAAAALILFGGMALTFFEWSTGTSLHAHLLGFAAGILSAVVLHKKRSILDALPSSHQSD